MENKIDFEYVKNYIAQHDQFGKGLNIKIEEIDLGYAKTSMALEPIHLNSANVAHGGAIFALVDLALAVAASTYGKLALTAAASISYIAAGTKGPITAVARELSNTRRLGTYEVKVTDGDGQVIAIAQATMYRKSQDYPPKES